MNTVHPFDDRWAMLGNQLFELVGCLGESALGGVCPGSLVARHVEVVAVGS
jgi:hypothetical protein